MPPTIGETKKQKSSVMPLFAVLLFGATFVAGYMVGTTKGGQGGSGYDAGYATGVAAISAKMEASGLLPETVEVKTINGTVVSIDESSMVIEVPQLVRNPLAEPAPTTRTVRLGEATTVAELLPKTAEELRKEFDAAIGSSKKPDGERTMPPPPPLPFTKKAMKLSDIEIGAMVAVTAAEDILRAETFDAMEIQLVQRPLQQVGAPLAPDSGALAPAGAPLGAPVTPGAIPVPSPKAPLGAPTKP